MTFWSTMAPRGFQPTLPVRGATEEARGLLRRLLISTHAPRAGSDFLLDYIIGQAHISTHAPRAGSDTTWTDGDLITADFNPRSPCGERRRGWHSWSRVHRFQPTLPVRGATIAQQHKPRENGISTHAPRAGSDHLVGRRLFRQKRFQPTLPVRGATAGFGPFSSLSPDFNPRSPCGERHWTGDQIAEFSVFQPTLPVRGATRGH